tara:strand:+ start:48 stop:1217 length:1170 start_codon:yes stop_codon:yes gene_type:complete
MIVNIEDCLEYLAGLHKSPATFSIEKTDYTIMNSIARQVFRGTALTDRQFNLMKEKLVNYKQQFVEAGVDNFDDVISKTREPIREIDRSKYIKIDNDNIIVRFPFKKTDIMLIHEISPGYGYSHNKGSHQHIFDYTEINVLSILDQFSKKDFIIDDELIEVYNKIKSIKNNPQEYLSGISNNQLINIKPALTSVIQTELGELTNETVTQFVDRRFRYGFNYIEDLPSITLAQKIATRKEVSYLSKPSLENSSEILSALWDLNRFPMLVILDPDDAEQQLHELANHYRDILNPEEQSVLFRLEEADAGFNQLVKDRKLNNWVDTTTKLVYISKNKLPKLLINNDWKPSAAFSYNSYIDKFVDSYVKFNCDLIVYREETMSAFKKYSRYHG